MDFTTLEDCVLYIETRVLFHLRSAFEKVQDDLQVTHHPNSNLIAINFREEVEFEGEIYKGMNIMISPENQNPENFNKFANISGVLISRGENNNRNLQWRSLVDILLQIFQICRNFYAD